MKLKTVLRPLVEAARRWVWKPCTACVGREVIRNDEIVLPSGTRKSPPLDPRIAQSFKRYDSSDSPLPRREILTEFEGGGVVEPTYGWLLCGHERFVPASLPYTYYTKVPRVRSRAFSKAHGQRRADADVAFSFRDVGDGNYYHMFSETLGKIAFLERCGRGEGLPLIISRQRFSSRSFQEALAEIKLEKLRWLVQDANHVGVRKLLVPRVAPADPKTIEWIQERVENVLRRCKPTRKLYVRRGCARRRSLANEPEIESVLVPLGFEPVDPGTLSLNEQMRCFATARIVVGAHGAALSNVLFCRRAGAMLIELFPPYNIPPMFRWIAEGLDLGYGAVCGEVDSLRTQDHGGSSEEPYRVEPSAITAMIRAVEARC